MEPTRISGCLSTLENPEGKAVALCYRANEAGISYIITINGHYQAAERNLPTAQVLQQALAMSWERKARALTFRVRENMKGHPNQELSPGQVKSLACDIIHGMARRAA